MSDEELRRRLANLQEIVQEAPLRGTPPDIRQRAELRLRELDSEYRRRTAATPR